ncbi:CaiB/BaiF CoA transferase family protein [Amycolatopsis echigonensis]|uniref:CoA transferase n=1 Tax=Amycolatopsis echigonensis TaxID=2576905 RepID=A0A8E2B8L0_9PSEU|nr:CaiB/BaiF CoA-transferase family protein [Amycolatopsis echigonensis]MBB2505141.1 CoA transferase [Amycolatopsis echigonensis]
MNSRLGFPRVVDFSVHFSGPIASRHLAQMGADVLKVEAPRHGDGNRWDSPRIGDVSALHFYLNAGARSLVFDGRSPHWRELVEACARWADVVIVGNTPARAVRLGIDPATMLGYAPELVYCAITGYGLDGPWRDLPAHGLNTDAYAGTVPLVDDNGTPVVPGEFRSAGTTLAGVEAALGIFAGLARQRAGFGGQFVHVSAWESALAWQWRDTTIYANTGQSWLRYRDLGSRYAVYRCADEKALLVCPIEHRFWEAFCDVLELPEATRARGDWSHGVDYGSDHAGEAAEIQERMRLRPRDEWERMLSAEDVPVAPILDWREAMNSEHAQANGAMNTVDYQGTPVTVPNVPVSVTSAAELGDLSLPELAEAHRHKGDHMPTAPRLGEHTDEALKTLGMPEHDTVS